MSQEPASRAPAETNDVAGLVRSLRGPDLWRSLEQVADTAEFRAWVRDEFPGGVDATLSGVDRRQFLAVMAASFALAGLTACTGGPPEKIVPYVDRPEEIVPGKPLFFASAVTREGYGHGVLVESHMGRPTKVEGNPDHPSSLGATDPFTQAAVLGLYDPDRSQTVVGPDGIAIMDELLAALRGRLDALRATGGRGLRLLTGELTSPTLLAQIDAFMSRYPGARWHVHEAISRDNALRGAEIAFGRSIQWVHRLDRAGVVVCLDEDLLYGGPANVRHARDWADHRRARAAALDAASMNRLYVAEPTPTVTGSKADDRLPARRSDVPALARALAVAVGVPGVAGPVLVGAQARWIEAAANDLRDRRGRGLVVAGAEQPPAVHALAYAINAALGDHGVTTIPVEPFTASGSGRCRPFEELVADMRSGGVDTLLALGVNPVYDAPADLAFAAALTRVPLSVHAGLYRDETGHTCTWHVPLAHDLERWGDVRGHDGTPAVIQPLIAPLYGAPSIHELVALINGDVVPDGREIVRGYWRSRTRTADFERWWREALRRGSVIDEAPEPIVATLDTGRVAHAAAELSGGGVALELVFTPDPTVRDGRYANSGWMQELPKQVSGLTWDNAALVAPALARRLGVENRDVVELRIAGRRVEAAAWIVPGQADGCVAASLGYGRRNAGRVGDERGFDAFALRDSAHLWAVPGLEMHRTGRRTEIATTQNHQVIEGRDMFRGGTLAEFVRDPSSAARVAEGGGALPSLYPPVTYEGQQWGMVVDLTACIGCGACTVACQAENNIPVVGKQQVIAGREMHWIRVDRYFQGNPDRPGIAHQPVPCMQCENAPCELVCPVGATQHSKDGLNEMIYNRCIGTRYCSNNCPYKVRRFNFFRFTDDTTETLKMLRNPDVTVRGRGVMEKCTYCVQRIRAADITAREENRPIRDGEVVTACQQACPTRAITFGDINDPGSAVAALKRQPHNYSMLRELNTRPRTSYLAEVRNPAPGLSPRGEDA
jgi:MoCo/4Fe-4S cofactor protein with predicted Tat translocation signal